MAEKNHLVPYVKEQLTEAVKMFTHHERPFQKTRQEKVTDLTKLRPGDHVSFYKTDLYYSHHGIVCEARENYLRVIHYFNTLAHARSALMKGSVYIAAIIESEWSVNLKSKSEDVFLHHYDGIKCFTNEETLQRAFSQLGRRGYSLISNNCEHWSRWCRTGEHFSEQIYKFRRLVKEKTATLLIMDPTALLVKDVALVGVQTFGQFLSAVGSGVVLTAVESISAYIDIRKKKNERKKGSLSDVAFKKYVIRRITSASTTVVGGTAGTVVGTILIPVPILGSTVGGVIGSVGGKLVGDISGIALSKIVEVYDRIKEAKVKKMVAIPQLMNHLSPQSELLRGLINISVNREEEVKITSGIQEAMNSEPSRLYPSLEEFIRISPTVTPEKCRAASQLTTELFPESSSYDYFVLTPVPDENAAEEFASSTDLLVLRWPIDSIKPWESGEAQVLDINDLDSNKQ
ncbi:unnamed protein product [Adineta ricciae]|uniref:LRAT domain-containing protein n=1 Tax=Adineta ricciae TaxID=249248 RepID=A0A814UDF4_ADIRI|nr:unnamed protein product [Adineta ricciae]CAF1324378.1 unnamed protein product [Adineta ricciae]